MNESALTKNHMQALLQIEGGATIYDYTLAKTLREVQKIDWRLLTIVDDIEELERITGEKYSGVEKVPYFGACLSEKGKKFVEEIKEIDGFVSFEEVLKQYREGTDIAWFVLYNDEGKEIYRFCNHSAYFVSVVDKEGQFDILKDKFSIPIKYLAYGNWKIEKIIYDVFEL